MKSSEILRRAAKRTEDGAFFVGGCIAISWECSKEKGRFKLADRCQKYFNKIRPPDANVYWWPRHPQHGPRIIGLCLAAAIAESEGD